jgi:uncharacterized phage infection (PIP) family protein YhgE
MTRHISTSQLKSKLRQTERKAKQAINQYNSNVRKYNSEVRKINRELNQAISNYNSAVRKYNSQVQHNRQVINREILKLKATATTHVQYSCSVTEMHNSYDRVVNCYDEGVEITPEQEHILDLVEQEQANGLIVTNQLFKNQVAQLSEDEIADIAISDKLSLVSEDLMNRWKGAVYALNPQNPDAARHFCTSAREIFTEFIELKAPDSAVFQYNPSAAKTDRGNATRKEKIKYMMHGKSLDNSVTDFADADITNILELFHVLSDGTHGAAGRYQFSALVQVKRRVEQGINFLCAISA